MSIPSTTNTDVSQARYICKQLWLSSAGYLNDTKQEKTLINLSYYWAALLFSVRDILDTNHLTDEVQNQFIPSLSIMFNIPFNDAKTLDALKGIQQTTYQTLVNCGYPPSSKESIREVLELANLFDNSDDIDFEKYADPQYAAEYMMTVLDLTKYITSLLSRPVTPIQHPSTNSVPAPQRPAPKSSKPLFDDIKPWIIFAIIAAIIILIIVVADTGDNGAALADNSPASTTRPQTESTYTEDTLVAQKRPANGRILKHPSAERVAPLTVKASGLTDYYILLKHRTNHSRSMAVYVRAGLSVNVDVPLGEYEIYYATGSTWYGTDNLFGSDTMYYKCEDTFPFTYSANTYNGWTLTLYPVSNGNMDTEIIDAYEFPN